MTVIDPRLATALRDESGARIMLNDLHQQILNCRDTAALTELTGKYIAVAVMRQLRGSQSTLAGPSLVRTTMVSQQQLESRVATTVSNITKTAHDTAKSTISNIKA